MTTSAAATYSSVQDWYKSVASSTTSTSTASKDQTTRFLTLLTTQLQNQDPTSPMDSSQMTSQLAQISTVTELEKLNTSLTSMMGNSQASETMQAANLVGHSVLLEGKDLKLSGSVAVGGIELESPASSVIVSILDSNGNVVQTLDLGEQDEGVSEFAWDGKSSDGTTLKDGTYTIKIAATDSNGSVGATALQFSTVCGVATVDGKLQIDVGSDDRVSMSDIKLIV